MSNGLWASLDTLALLEYWESRPSYGMYTSFLRCNGKTPVLHCYTNIDQLLSMVLIQSLSGLNPLRLVPHQFWAQRSRKA